MLFGAKVIKICVDCKPWGYSVDDIKLFIREAAKAGLKVAGHVQTSGRRAPRDRGGHLVDRARQRLNDEIHKLMAQKGIFRAGTETPMSLAGHRHRRRYERTVAGLKNAWENKVAAHLFDRRRLLRPRQDARRGAIEFLETWKAAGIPPADILRR